jgi:hypothetical protein
MSERRLDEIERCRSQCHRERTGEYDASFSDEEQHREVPEVKGIADFADPN